ncbi:MAG TPA: acyltransferase [Isosphaeraceae bacterium]|jgi:peptidoglycan/LPS O-acetylase OafA/YrhL|nr:acyltransferase [Isosphaeraceae bacterium]
MRRVPELDALRGIAAITIVMYHLRYMLAFPLLGTAVDLFFVLSGYLITTILLDGEGRPAGPFLRAFYARRALRIWPIYYLTLAALLAVNRRLPWPQPTSAWPFFATYTQFVQAYWSGPFPPFSRHFLHTWTLAIEEQFYLFWPLLVRWSGRRRLGLLIVPLLATPIVLRSRGMFGHLLLTRCDGLAWGAVLALVLRDGDRVRRRPAAYRLGFAAVIGAALSFAAWRRPFLIALIPLAPSWPWLKVAESLSIARMAAFHFGVVGLVACLAGSRWVRILRRKPLVFLGQISYGLYLYHPFVFVLVAVAHQSLGIKGSVWIDTGKVALCLAVASLSWWFVERPLLALKERFRDRDIEPSGLFRGPHAAPVAVRERT